MRLFKILSIVSISCAIACFFGLWISVFVARTDTGAGTGLSGLPIFFICGFVGFGLLAGIFQSIDRHQSPFNGATPTGSSEGIDSLSQSTIKVRCPKCSELNDEDADFCKKCGTKLK
jgi:hypothetical protein